MSNIVTGRARFQNLERFLLESSKFGFLVDSKGETAFLSKQVFKHSGNSLEALTEHTILEVEVWWNNRERGWAVGRVIALHQPEQSDQPETAARSVDTASAALPREAMAFRVDQFVDLRPALIDGKHVNKKTGEGLFGVHDPSGALLYFVVVKDGAEEVIDRMVDTTDLAIGLKAIGKRLPRPKKAPQAKETQTAPAVPPAKPAQTTGKKPKPSTVKSKPMVISGLAGLAVLKRPAGPGDASMH